MAEHGALESLRHAILASADHELLRVNAKLHEAGIDYPQGAAGVSDLTGQRNTEIDRIIDLIEDEISDEEQRPGSGNDPRFVAGMQFVLDFLRSNGANDD